VPPKEDFDVTAAVHRCHCNFRADGIRDLRNGPRFKQIHQPCLRDGSRGLSGRRLCDAGFRRSCQHVSAKGSDANTCAITALCATMANVVTQTATNGVLHYFPSATLTTSITVDCSGTNAVTDTFTINLTIAGNVHIKSLIILDTGASGIDFKQGTALSVEDCNVYGKSTAILFEPYPMSNCM
jgi:hypothetical protein